MLKFPRPLTKSMKFILRVERTGFHSFENCKITKFTKTTEFTIICRTIDRVYVIYSKDCREGTSKVTRIAITHLPVNE